MVKQMPNPHSIEARLAQPEALPAYIPFAGVADPLDAAHSHHFPSPAIPSDPGSQQNSFSQRTANPFADEPLQDGPAATDEQSDADVDGRTEGRRRTHLALREQYVASQAKLI